MVASGTLANGDRVILKADGTIEAVGVSSTSMSESIPAGSETSPANKLAFYTSVVYTDTAGVFIMAYKDSPTSTGRAAVGTVSGTSITFGTEYVFESSSSLDYIDITYDPNTSGSFVIVYRHYSSSSSYGRAKAIAGTISGTTLTFGTGVLYSSNPASFTKVDFDPFNTGNFIVAYYNAGSLDEGIARVGTVSGTSISFGTAYTFESNPTSYITASFDPNTSGSFIIGYRVDVAGTEYGHLRAGTISGTTLTYGTRYTFNSSGTYDMDLAFVTNTANKFVIVYKDASNSYYASSRLGTISGTSVSVGARVTARSANPFSLAVEFDPSDATRFVVFSTGSGAYAVVGTLSGSTLSYGSQNTINSTSGGECSLAFDSNTPGKFVTAYQSIPHGEAVVGQLAVTITTTNLTSTNLLGIAQEAAADGATVSVETLGGLSAVHTGLTVGSDYYVASDGSLTTTATDNVSVGKAVSATTINMRDYV